MKRILTLSACLAAAATSLVASPASATTGPPSCVSWSSYHVREVVINNSCSTSQHLKIVKSNWPDDCITQKAHTIHEYTWSFGPFQSIERC